MQQINASAYTEYCNSTSMNPPHLFVSSITLSNPGIYHRFVTRVMPDCLLTEFRDKINTGDPFIHYNTVNQCSSSFHMIPPTSFPANIAARDVSRRLQMLARVALVFLLLHSVGPCLAMRTERHVVSAYLHCFDGELPCCLLIFSVKAMTFRRYVNVHILACQWFVLNNERETCFF